MSDKAEMIDELDSDYGDAEEYDEDPNVFQIRDPLKPPSASVYTTQELHQLIHEGHIDLNPPYQRAFVWPQEKQIALIESIFRNFYIPPVLFFVRPESDVDSDLPLRVCMDGKQRLSSIQAFFDGQVSYRDPLTKKKFYYTVPPSQSSKKVVIPQKFKDIFANKQITCVEFRKIDPAIERDIFQRVQMGVTLTAAEKLAAISSPYADWITELDVKHIRDADDGLGTRILWDSRRGKHFQCLAQMIYCCERLPLRSDPSSAKLTSWLHRLDAPGQQFKQEIENVLNSYWIIASSEDLRAPFTVVKQMVAPVEFVFIGVLIAVLRDCSDKKKSEEVLKLRVDVRKEHKDVRANTRVIASMWNAIDQAKTRQGVDGAAMGTTTDGRKRRRGMDADDDYRPTPIKSLGGAPKTRARLAK
ncbi:hypothetical protein DFH11DRAFT_1686192 [Phellopilus nigrolimitatus]|nr:hypothetical protein DFH11DRAFT_1686192 [Phellopilus nigrolimitatus]